MFDIHFHLLFGVDDGPNDIEASLALAEASIAEGVTHIVCTPHANSQHSFQPELNRERLAMLNERLDGRVTLGLGCDFHLSFDNLEDAFQNKTKYTINGKRYLLVEFPETGIVHQMSGMLCRFLALGIVPIITHPERNPILAKAPGRIVEWMRSGCLVQVTAASLTGRFGKQAEAMSNELIKKNWVQFIASDRPMIFLRLATARPPRICCASTIRAPRSWVSLCLRSPNSSALLKNRSPRNAAF
jgi:protein-tyrosine phosphatase